MGLFSRWTDRKHFDVDRVVDSLGNVPPELLFASFDMLRPASRVAGQVRLWDSVWNDALLVRSFRMVESLGGGANPPSPGECFRQFVKDFMWANKLVERDVRAPGGARCAWGTVEVHCCVHVAGQHDHVRPL
ncbi:MAG: hypothetical protein U5Q44_14205 [Dehalococcoidia bacterium]|nr:hypothetical protein [Dehalococcoidia bacterium]